MTLKRTKTQEKQNETFLGIQHQQRLQWTIQVDKVVKKLAERVYLLRNNCCSRGKKILRSVYSAHFHSILVYGLFICISVPNLLKKQSSEL